MDSTRKINIEILNQLKFVLDQFGPLDYKKGLKVLNKSSIGQHSRHIVEFYQCLFSGSETLSIDYDARSRDLQIESDIVYAKFVLNEIIQKFDSDLQDKIIKLKVCFISNESIMVDTTLQRELVYLIEHTIHHLAIINIALQEEFPEIETPTGFGVAYSTIMHNNSVLSA